MGIKQGNKQEEIKIRLTKEQKDLIKRVAKQQKTSMSDFILSYIEPIARNKDFDINNKTVVEERVENTEWKIQELKRTMEQRKGNNKNFIKKIFNKL